MNEPDIFLRLVDRADLALAKAEAGLRALTKVLAEALEKGDSVPLRDFGSVRRTRRGATTAPQPANRRDGRRAQAAVGAR